MKAHVEDATSCSLVERVSGGDKEINERSLHVCMILMGSTESYAFLFQYLLNRVNSVEF